MLATLSCLDLHRCGTNNSAIFAEIVPEEKRSTVYAFDRSFEGAVAACAAPVVGEPHPVPLSPNAPSLNLKLAASRNLLFAFRFWLCVSSMRERWQLVRRHAAPTSLHDQ